MRTKPSCMAFQVVLSAVLFLSCGPVWAANDQSGGVTLSASLARLNKDSVTLDTDVQQLSVRSHKVSQVLGMSAKAMAVPSIMAKDLAKLETLLKQMDSAAQVAETIPQTREDAKKMRDSIGPTLKDVTAAKEKARKLADRVDPVRVRVKTASDAAEALSLGLTVLDNDVLKNIPAATQISQVCVNNSADTKKGCMQAKLDGKADELDKLVLEMDKAIKPLIASYVPTMPALSILGRFSTDLKVLDDLRRRMEVLEKKLETIQAALSELTSLLDKEFKVHFSGHSVGIRMRTIIQGADAIEKEMEHLLSKVAWKIAKEFGVGKLVKTLENDAQKELDKTLKKLNLSALASLAALNDLERFEASVDRLLADFPKDFSIPAFDTKLPDFGLPGVAVGLDLRLMSVDLKWISPNVFDLKHPNICKGVSYECK